MSWKKLLSIQSAILGFMGSLFLCFGSILLSVEQAEEISASYVGHNPHFLESLLLQKTDTIIGAILIAVAFVLQFVVLTDEDKLNSKEVKKKKGKLIIGLMTCVFILITVVFRYLLL